MKTQCTISGRLGSDPELFSPQKSDYSCLSFSIANDDDAKKNQETGEYDRIVSWFRIVFWTKNPQKWIRELHKGDLVVVSVIPFEDRGDNYSAIKFKIAPRSFPIVIRKKQEATDVGF